MLQESGRTVEEEYEEVKQALRKEYNTHDAETVFEALFKQRKIDILNDYADFLLNRL